MDSVVELEISLELSVVLVLEVETGVEVLESGSGVLETIGVAVVGAEVAVSFFEEDGAGAALVGSSKDNDGAALLVVGN